MDRTRAYWVTKLGSNPIHSDGAGFGSYESPVIFPVLGSISIPR